MNNITVQSANLENQFRVTVVQTLGGIAVIAGLISTYQKLLTLKDGQVTDRYTKAIEQLGNDQLALKLGGIYALERISIESKKDYWPIMEILTTYVRENSQVKDDKPKSEAKENQNEAPLNYDIKADIQAILNVFGRRSDPNNAGKPFNLQKTCLRKADLYKINLKGAHLEGADLAEANLRGSHLEGAHLEGADLTEVNLRGAHLERASFTEMSDEFVIKKANLQGAYLEGAHLEKANLREVHLKEAHLEGAHLEGADLQGACLEGAHLEGAYLEGASLGEVPYYGIKGANLKEAHLDGADLTEADLRGVCVKGAYFERACLKGADLTNVDFRYDILPNSLIFPNISDPKLTIDQLSKAKTLCGAQFNTELEEPLRDKHKHLFDNCNEDI